MVVVGGRERVGLGGRSWDAGGAGVGEAVAFGAGEGEGTGERVTFFEVEEIVEGVEPAFFSLSFSSLTLATSALVFNLSHPLLVGKNTAGPGTFPSFPATTTFLNNISSLDASLSFPIPAAFPKGVFQSGGSQETESTTLIIESARLNSFACFESMRGRRVAREEGSRTG